MKVFLLCLFCFIFLFFISCKDKTNDDKLSSMGLVESVIGRNEVHSAMNTVNELIKKNNLKEIHCGWEYHDFDNKNFYYFITQPEGLPLKTIAQNSKENSSIFISSSWRSICDETFHLSESDSIVRTHILVFVILHEVGHLIGQKNYSKFLGREIKIDSLLLKNPNNMKEEIFADFFAAEVVRNDNTEIGKKLKKDIEELSEKVDYYFYSRYEIHGSPLSMMLSEPAKRFGDLTYSHPNLNLRLQLISYLIKPTSEKLHRLKWIQEQRKLYFNINTFTPDVMDGLTYLKKIPDSVKVAK